MLLNLLVLTILLLTHELVLITCAETDEQPSDDKDLEKELKEFPTNNDDYEGSQDIHDSKVVDNIQDLTSTTTTTTTIAPTTTTTTTTVIPTTSTTTTTTKRSQPLTEDTISIRHGCVSIKFDAKVFIKYNSNDGIQQVIQIIGGNINGELSHENKCDETQHLMVDYEQISGCFLSVWLHLNATHIFMDEMLFEYPIELLDKYPENSTTALCSKADNNYNSYDLRPQNRVCVVAKNSAKNYLMPYKLNEYVRCLETPLVTMNTENNNQTIDVILTNLNIRVTNSTDDGLNANEYNNNSSCPIDIGNDNPNDDGFLQYSHTQIWLGVSYAIIGAVFIFGVVFIYEKVIRKKFRYSSVRRRRHEK